MIASIDYSERVKKHLTDMWKLSEKEVKISDENLSILLPIFNEIAIQRYHEILKVT